VILSHVAVCIIPINIVLTINLVVFICIDPQTKAWLEDHKHHIFGFPTLVRFSWGTCNSYFKDIAQVLW